MIIEDVSKHNEYYIVRIFKGNHNEWVVCKDFDDTKPEGSKWTRGHYCYSEEDALNYVKEN